MTPEPDTPSAPVRPQGTRKGPWRRLRSLHWVWQALIAFLALVAAWALVCWLVLPPVARSLLADNLAEVLSRPVAVEAVRLNPFTLRLEIQGVTVLEPGSGEVFASLDLLVADAASVSLVRWAVVMDQVALDGPYLHLVLGPDGTNLDDLLVAGGDEASALPAEDAHGENVGEMAGGGIFPVVVRDFAVTGGRVVVDDHVRGRSHEIKDMDLRVPFASSLSDDTDRFVRPSFRAVVNGSPLVMTGRAKPFDRSLRSEFDFKLQGVDLIQWWPYVPAPPSLNLAGGTLGLDLILGFERGKGLLPVVSVSGDVALSGLALEGPDGPLLGFRTLDVELERFGLLEREVRLGLVRLEEPVARLALANDGVLDWIALLSSEGALSSVSEQSESEPSMEEDGPFVVAARRLELARGRVEFMDRAVSGGFSKVLDSLELVVDGFSTAPGMETTFTLAAGPGDGEHLAVNGTLSFGDHDVDTLAASGELSLSGLSLPAYDAYYGPALPLRLDAGSLGVRCAWNWGREDKGLVVDGLSLGLRDLALALPGEKKAFLRLPAVDVRDASLDLDARRVAVAEAVVSGGSARLTRMADGSVDVAAALVPAASERDAAEAGPGWVVSLDRAAVQGLNARFRDLAAPGAGVDLELSGIKATLEGWSIDADGPMPVALSARMGQGTIETKGELSLSPLAVSGALELAGLGLRPLSGYLPATVGLALSTGEVGVKGGFSFSVAAPDSSGDAPMNAGFTGSAVVAGLSATDGLAGEEVVGLGRLEARGVSFGLEPLVLVASGLTLERPVLRLERETDGRMNLARLLGASTPPPEGAGNATAQDSPADIVPDVLTTAPASEPVGKGQGEDDFPFQRLAVGEFALTGGLITFRDLTLAPAFASELDDLELRVSGLSLPGDVAARVTASAMQDGQAPVSVSGTMGMAVDDMFLDLRLGMENYGLTRVSPYSLRHVAHPIERGKLDLDIGLRVEGPVLDMDNVMRFGQLAFGAKQDVPGAADVPLGLAMALLADGEGNMELDVPVQGRLDDPQFRLGKVITKAILNLIWKVVTSPFALIGNLFGGGDDADLDQVDFQAGRAELTARALGKLATLSTALGKRPRLKLEVTGRAAEAQDAPALADLRLDMAVRRAAMADMGKKAPATPGEVRFEPGQYEEYLREVYEDAPMDKESGFLGPKEQPVAIMEAMLKEHFKATAADVDELARQRAGAVRDRLLESGVAPERIYIRAYSPGAQTPGAAESGGQEGSRVDLKLE